MSLILPRDPYIAAASFFYVLALLLGAYLLACGINALYERWSAWRIERLARAQSRPSDDFPNWGIE